MLCHRGTEGTEGEEVIARYPCRGNIGQPEDTYDYQYFGARFGRACWLSGQAIPPPEYHPGQIF